MGFFDILSAIGSVFMILVLIVLAYYTTRWYAKRSDRLVSGKYVKVVDRTTLGNNAALLIVCVSGKYYLLGVSEKNMELLCELEDFAPEEEPDRQGQVAFQEVFQKFMHRTKSHNTRDDGGME